MYGNPVRFSTRVASVVEILSNRKQGPIVNSMAAEDQAMQGAKI